LILDNSSRSTPGRPATLKLLAAPPRPPRPPYIPARRLPRRPGERREPLVVPLLPHALTQAAAERGLDLGCAVELCLERALVVRDLADVGVASLYPRLLALASTTRVRRALPPAKARYLQVLLAALDHRSELTAEEHGASEAVIDIPLRLFPRVVDVVPSAQLDASALDEALRLEVAAVGSGRSMSEWAALAALGLSR
jgi:hypothetical protein